MPSLRLRFLNKPSDRVVAESAVNFDDEVDGVNSPEKLSDVGEHSDEVSTDAEEGIKKLEAAQLVWPRKALYFVYAWIWVCFFILALQSSIAGYAYVNAYSSFAAAPQINTAYILSSIIGGIIRLPLAKLLNIWGRCEAFLLFVAIFEIGIIVIASSNGPNAAAAGYVLYWIGYDMIYMILDVFMADTTGLRNRAFAFGFASTPFICTAFTGPRAYQSFVSTGGWRWAYGTFAIVNVAVFVPIAIVFKFYSLKASKMGVYKHVRSERTIFQSIVHYFHEFDVIGMFILMAAFCIFLVPFSLVTYGRATYGSATFIAMVVVGFCLFPVYYLWERYGARTHFIPYDLVKDPSVFGACCLAGIAFFSFYCWDNTFYNFVMVSYNLSISDAGYMTQIYNVGSCFWGVVFGLIVRYTKHFKYICLCFFLPLMMLGAGLMIHFRGSEHGIGYVVMCQIFIAFGGGSLVIGEDMAVMAASPTIEGVPMMLALLGLSSSVGGAIGDSVAAAIYNKVFPDTLRRNLPASTADDWATIFTGGYLTQMTYPIGSATRDAINLAYGDTQKYGAVAATCILILGFPAIGIWKNFNVDRKQNKGAVL